MNIETIRKALDSDIDNLKLAEYCAYLTEQLTRVKQISTTLGDLQKELLEKYNMEANPLKAVGATGKVRFPSGAFFKPADKKVVGWVIPDDENEGNTEHGQISYMYQRLNELVDQAPQEQNGKPKITRQQVRVFLAALAEVKPKQAAFKSVDDADLPYGMKRERIPQDIKFTTSNT